MFLSNSSGVEMGDQVRRKKGEKLVLLYLPAQRRDEVFPHRHRPGKRENDKNTSAVLSTISIRCEGGKKERRKKNQGFQE